MARKKKPRRNRGKRGKRSTGPRPDPKVRFLARRGVPEAQIQLGLIYALGRGRGEEERLQGGQVVSPGR
jgi:hypothetical protein